MELKWLSFEILIFISVIIIMCELFYMEKQQVRQIGIQPQTISVMRSEMITPSTTSNFCCVNDLVLHTSPKHTKIIQHSSNSNVFEAIIVARNYRNEIKKHGGDYFRVFMTKLYNPDDGITCDVTDVNNGRYHVTCPLVFNGTMILGVQLIHSSEVISMLKNKTSILRQPMNDIVTFISNGKGSLEQTFCNVELKPHYNSSQSCNYTTMDKGGEWFCVKPPSGICGTIESTRGIVKKRGNFLNAKEKELLDASSFQEISGSNQRILSLGATRNTNLPACYNFSYTFSSLGKGPAGFYENGRWNSLLCSNTDKFVKILSLFEECMRNKTLHMFGDSTTRQWFEYFEKHVMNMEANFKDPEAAIPPRKGIITSTNGIIYMRSHGEPLKTKAKFSYIQYIADSLNEIIDNKSNHIVTISMGLHFQPYNPNFFYNRIQNIKEAVLSLLTRLPTTKIFIRDVSMHKYKDLCPSPWLSHRLNKIMRAEFDDVHNVHHLNTWDMTSLHISQDVHPSEKMVEDQIALFQSFICE